MSIKKSEGFTETEKLLTKICDKTFMKIWSYTNPYNKYAKEFCDLISIFENHMFIFFDRNKKLELNESNYRIEWKRWKKKVIDAQVKTCLGAERYINNGGELFLDKDLKKEFPLKYDLKTLRIHKIIVAHGANEACLKFSKENINGSLAIHYSKFIDEMKDFSPPFLISLDNKNPIHIFDSHNLEIILSELDTFHDFMHYMVEKERVIKNSIFLSYAGEEDLLANYIRNFDKVNKEHFICDKKNSGLVIQEGLWNDFIKTPAYKSMKEENKISYFWDDLLQSFCDDALNDRLKGNGDVFLGRSGIYEMAKEPRFFRRLTSSIMVKAIKSFPKNDIPFGRSIEVFDSYFKKVKYVFLQYKIDFPDKKEVNMMRKYFLEIACGVTKNKFPETEKVIGISIPIPYIENGFDKDILLMDCSNWTEENKQYYEKENQFPENRFFLQESLTLHEYHLKEFPESKLK